MSSITSSSSQPSWTNVQSIKQYDENHNFIQEREDDDGSDFLSQPYSTLDEPVSETIMRDLKSVGNKLKAVLLAFDKKDVTEYVKVSIDEDVVPTENQKHVISTLKDWDLWSVIFMLLNRLANGLSSSLFQVHIYIDNVYSILHYICYIGDRYW